MDQDARVQALGEDLRNLIPQWEELGIDPDDFVRCGTCHEFFVSEDGQFIDCACEKKR